MGKSVKVRFRSRPVLLVFLQGGNIAQGGQSPTYEKAPGRLYGIKADEWASLALAAFFGDTHEYPQMEASQRSAGAQDCPRTRTFPPGKGMPPQRGRLKSEENNKGRAN